LVKEYTESLSEILVGLMLESDSEEEEDETFHGAVISNRNHLATKPTKEEKIPKWIREKMEVDARNKVTLSTSHYMG
jgi:hypothetical protein